MMVRINPAATLNGLPAIDMENEGLRVTVLPDPGAKIYDLVCKRTGRNFLWHNPRIAPHRYAIESNFDNHWCGGWDEGFPTCDECDYRGEHYPNLGELRSGGWQVASAETAGGNAVAELTTFGPISPVRARKAVILEADQPVLTVQYGIENLGPLCLDFIWGTHPALNPTERMLLRIPAKTGFVGQASHPSLGEPGQRYPWPILDTASGTTDMSRTQPANAGVFCGHYATDLEAGWYAVEDESTGDGFLLTFPVDLCPYLWMWLVYGGWRGYHHVIVEPWTSRPVNLATAVKQRTARRLEPGEKFEVEVHASIYIAPETWADALRRLRPYGTPSIGTGASPAPSRVVTAVPQEKRP